MATAVAKLQLNGYSAAGFDSLGRIVEQAHVIVWKLDAGLPDPPKSLCEPQIAVWPCRNLDRIACWSRELRYCSGRRDFPDILVTVFSEPDISIWPRSDAI